jgi:hypothetical protein
MHGAAQKALKESDGLSVAKPIRAGCIASTLAVATKNMHPIVAAETYPSRNVITK